MPRRAIFSFLIALTGSLHASAAGLPLARNLDLVAIRPVGYRLPLKMVRDARHSVAAASPGGVRPAESATGAASGHRP